MDPFSVALFALALLDATGHAVALESITPHAFGAIYCFHQLKADESESVAIAAVERARQMKQASEAVKTLSMMPQNGAELLRFLKQPILADQLSREPHSLICMLQRADGKAMPCECDAAEEKSTDQMGLCQVVEIKNGCFHVAIAQEAQSLKATVKTYKQALASSHQERGHKLGLWTPTYLTERGCQVRALLKEWVRSQYQTFGATEIYPLQETLEPTFNTLTVSFSDPLESSLLDSYSPFDSACMALSSLSLDSLLQFIIKTIKMLGIEQSVSIFGRPKHPWANTTKTLLRQTNAQFIQEDRQDLLIEWDLLDALGRKWQGATVTLSLKPTPLVKATLVSSLNRYLALLLEQKAGTLPFFLQPKEMVVLPTSKQFEKEAERWCCELARFSVRSSLVKEGALKARVQQAHVQQAPILAFVGKEEVALEKLTCVVEGASPELLSKECLVEMIMEKRKGLS